MQTAPLTAYFIHHFKTIILSSTTNSDEIRGALLLSYLRFITSRHSGNHETTQINGSNNPNIMNANCTFAHMDDIDIIPDVADQMYVELEA